MVKRAHKLFVDAGENKKYRFIILEKFIRRSTIILSNIYLLSNFLVEYCNDLILYIINQLLL